MATQITRRQILSGAALAAAAGAAGGFGRSLSALASITVGTHTARTGSDTLVVLFLRGGADGLNILVPHADDDYHRLRPTLGLARPNDARTVLNARTIDLDGFYGLHPSLAPLYPLYKQGQLAAIHAIGSGDQTRSHFEAMATMERGLAHDTGAASGWLARHLTSTATETDPPLRAVAVSETVPDALRGASNVTALTNLADFRLNAPNILPTGADNAEFHAPASADRANALTDTLKGMYGGSGSTPDSLRAAGAETLSAIDAVHRLDPANYRAGNGAVYPDTELGKGFRQVACMIKGEVGLEVACLDLGGWDTHVAQGRDTGWQPLRLAELGGALAAFAADMGGKIGRITTVVMTEFGRRAYENSGYGTDHGRGGCMFLMGGGVLGGKVYAEWPGLGPTQLDGPGDLRVTTDYRDILAEIVTKRLKNPHLTEVFPEYTPRPRNVVQTV